MPKLILFIIPLIIMTACSPGSLGTLVITPAPSPTPTDSPFRVVTVDPNEPPLEARNHYHKGLTYVAAGLPEEAIASFDQAIALAPDYAEAYFQRGLAHHNLGDPDKAGADYRRVLELNPEPDIRATVEAGLQRLPQVNPTATPEAAPSPTSQPTPAANPTRSQEPPLEIQKDQPFVLMTGQTAYLPEADLSLTFVTVLEDSRCPSQVNCAWAGQAIIAVQAQQADQTASLELNSNPPLKQDVASFAGQIIRFVALDPYPEHPDRPIPLEDYKATLVVTEGTN